jgi:hypothetical protein
MHGGPTTWINIDLRKRSLAETKHISVSAHLMKPRDFNWWSSRISQRKVTFAAA